MRTYELESQGLEQRRRQLGISRPALAKRSGLSQSTVTRMLSGHLEQASLASVRSLAAAMGIRLATAEEADVQKLREQAAQEKARRLVGLVQGTSALEAQAVDDKSLEQMIRQTVHDLMAGSNRRLWA